LGNFTKIPSLVKTGKKNGGHFICVSLQYQEIYVPKIGLQLQTPQNYIK
jgi:hypothetical protein